LDKSQLRYSHQQRRGARSQSQTVAVRISRTPQSSRTQHDQVSTETSHLQDVYDPSRFSGGQYRKAVFRSVAELVHVESFNGTILHNPYNFQHFDLNEIAVYLDGQQVQSVRVLWPDFANRQYVDAYMSLFCGTNKINRDEGNFVSCKDYASGYSLYVYDLSLDLGENDHFNLIR